MSTKVELSSGNTANGVKSVQEENVAMPTEAKIRWQHVILLPSIFGLMFSIVLNSYIQNEWTQWVIKKQYLPNVTESHSGCYQDQANISATLEESYKTVQQVTAKWQVFFTVAHNVPTVFTVLILPPYTDTYGRKFVLVLSAAGMCISAIGLCLTIYFEASFWFILAAGVLCGITGSGFALLTAAFSMVSDVTHTPKHRTVGIVITEASVMVSVIFSSYFSGFFIETIDLGYFYTSLLSACISCAAALLILTVPETLTDDKKVKTQTVSQTLRSVSDFYVSAEFKGKRKVYFLLLIAFGFATLGGINRGSMETLYFLGKPFCWGPSKIGIFSMVRNASQTLIGLGAVRFLQRCFSSEMVGIISTLSNAASYVIEAFATTTLTIYLVPAAACFAFLVVPMIRTILSSMTPVDKQGAMYASITAMEIVCTMIANLSQNAVYSFTLYFMNGFVFLMLAVLSIINMLLMVAVRCFKTKDDNFEESVTIEKVNGKYGHDKL